MSLFDFIFKKNKPEYDPTKPSYEFCPKCDANLTLQKGYSNDLDYWICKGCGEMLYNPEIESEDGVIWVCDGCQTLLNIQPGFHNTCGNWKCTECGFDNKIDKSEIYVSEDEYQQSLQNPYKGLSDADLLEVLKYEEIRKLKDREDIVLVQDPEDNSFYIKKYLTNYDVSVYRYLLENPIEHMPKLKGVYEASHHLIVIEEYIEGPTLLEFVERGVLNEQNSLKIAYEICSILMQLHSLEKPIIHRDVKPSNVIISSDGILYLLDMNVAKWYKPEEKEDTKLLGTLYYAAPEQFGYGFSASSEKSDIYALGILLNVMLTGKLPKEKKADGAIWSVIEKCISLEPNLRYTATELLEELSTFIEEQ